MTLPGPIITQDSTARPTAASTNTGTLFVVAKTTGTASASATLVESPQALKTATGGRATGNAVLYDAIDAAFLHGLKRAYYVTTPSTGTPAEFADALELFEPELGPGQVLAVGYTGTDEAAVNAAVVAHAKATNRRALVMVTGADAAAIVTAAGTLRTSLDADAGLVAAFCQSATIPGIPALAVTERTVPWTAIQAGLIARVDALGNPNLPAAGENGIADKALALSAEYKVAADREDLADAGVNVVRVLFPGASPRTYDYVTLADPAKYPEQTMYSNVRLDMALAAEAQAIAERFQFKVLDGDRKTVNQFGGELSAMLAEYRRLGALFADAEVDVSEAVNPVENLAQGKLTAVMRVQRSPFARVTEVVYSTAPIA